MYLSSKQHDLLQILVTGFEIPYRSYVATEIISRFPTESAFSSELMNRQNFSTSNPDYQTINSELGKIKANYSHYYTLLQNAYNAKSRRIIDNEINIPNVSTLIALTIIFKELFSALILKFRDESMYLNHALKYKYVRNKLDHRGCKTLETTDMIITTEYIGNSLLLLCDDSSLFLEKNCDEIIKEVKALQTSKLSIPIPIHNIPEMPFPDMKIVCRDEEIAEIKEFVYGHPGALRKQASCVLYGYGGVGKTALILETIKQIVQDLQDNTTINSYKPEFILFFTAKEELLSFSRTTGNIENLSTRYSFTNADELISQIYEKIGIESFSDYNKSGLIIIDNLETVSADEREKINEFIRFKSPQQIQYIITSRNEEDYECRKKIAGFEDNLSGNEFINSYIQENSYNLELTDYDKKSLLDIAMGNTLVLVLCLRRLSLNLTTIAGIIADITSPTTVNDLQKEISQIPANGFNIISEFMFKNSFQEIREKYKANDIVLTSVLKIFAVYPSEAVDLYTISLIAKQPYSTINPVLELLCRYLIIEKSGDFYRINPFAEKYIIQLFMPDAETYSTIEAEIVRNTRIIQDELEQLQENIKRNSKLKSIIQDWNVVSDGDKIIVAKVYKLYGEVKIDCQKMSKFHVRVALNDAISSIETLEKNSMHPYVKFQKARIYKLINDTKILEISLNDEITEAFNDTIWTIKTNPIFSLIKSTKSYASILWLYGLHLYNLDTADSYMSAARYLEESKISFEQINSRDDAYYQCVLILAKAYLKIYLLDKKENLQYLRRARSLSNQLFENRQYYFGKTKGSAAGFREELKQYGRF